MQYFDLIAEERERLREEESRRDKEEMADFMDYVEETLEGVCSMLICLTMKNGARQ